MQLPVEHPLIIITGPTAVGKTQLSLDLVQSMDGEIISADSRLFYCGLDIGTAKPTIAEREQVKHHLIDIAKPDEALSLAIFQQSVYAIAQDLWNQGRIPFVVGGTGQFVRALMEGWEAPTLHPDTRIRTVLEGWGQKIGAIALHHKLEIIDPDAARSIDPGNLRRTVRALEVIMTSGRLFSTLRAKRPRGLQYKVIGLIRDRNELYMRVDERIKQMIQEGLIDEVQALMQMGYDDDLPALSAIGYKEAISYIRGEISMEDVVRLMKKRTRSYIRRQANWFKPDDPRIHWFTMESGVEKAIKEYIFSEEGWQHG